MWFKPTHYRSGMQWLTYQVTAARTGGDRSTAVLTRARGRRVFVCNDATGRRHSSCVTTQPHVALHALQAHAAARLQVKAHVT